MSRHVIWIALLLAGVTAACAAEPSDKASSEVTKKDGKGKDAKTDQKTPKAPRPGSEGPILAPPPLSPSSPRLEALTPASVVVNSANIELTVAGTQFAPEARVSIGGEDIRPAAVSATELRLTVPAAKLRAAGTLPVKITNPPTNGGSSNELSLTVASASAQMSISSLSPAKATAGAEDVTLTVSGAGFNNKMRVRFNGTDITTVSSTATSITATVPSTLLRIAGQISVSIFDPATSSVTTPQTFSIDRPPTSSASGSCQNRCVDFGYKTNQCFDDWQCRANGCLEQQKCAPTCQYRCADFDYAANQCFDGWVCTNGCLAPKTCETTTTTGAAGRATVAATSCTYACNGDAWSYAVGECKDNYECGSDNCLKPKACASSTTITPGAACEYACNDPEGLWSYRVGECKSGYECASDGCLRSKTCSTGTTTTTTTGGRCEYSCVDPDGAWAYSAGECRDGYECGTDSCLHQKTCTTAASTTTTTTASTCTYPCVDPNGAWAYAANECHDGYCCSSFSNCLFEETGF